MDVVEAVYDVSFEDSSREDLIALIKSMHGTIQWVREETERQCKSQWEARVNEADRAKEAYDQRVSELKEDAAYSALVDENNALKKRIAQNQRNVEMLSNGVLNSDHAYIELKNEFERYRDHVRWSMHQKGDRDLLQGEVERLQKLVAKHSKLQKQKTIKPVSQSKTLIASCDTHLL